MPLTNEEALHKDIVGVKVSSWILIILGIIGVISALVLIITGPFILGASGNAEVIEGVSESVGGTTVDGVSVDTGIAAVGLLVTIVGLVSFAAAVFDIITGVVGLRGAKDPRKINPFVILSWVTLVLAIVSFVIMLINHFMNWTALADSFITDISSGAASLVFAACCVFYGTRVKQLSSQN